jgi:hypothetical protein
MATANLKTQKRTLQKPLRLELELFCSTNGLGVGVSVPALAPAEKDQRRGPAQRPQRHNAAWRAAAC